MFEEAKTQSPERTGTYSKTTREASKQIPTTLSALEKEVKQLRMENELLRDFLKAAERK